MINPAPNSIFKKTKRRIIGEVLKTGEVRTDTAWVSVHTSSQKDMVTYEGEGLVVSINGSGSLPLEHAQCVEAQKLAGEIAKRGGIVMTGGRSSGIMEAAASAAGEKSLGVIFPEIEKDASRYGAKVVVNSPQPRIELLGTCSPVIVLFRGGLGTLMTLMRAIVHIKNRSYHLQQLPQLVFVSNYWIGLLHTMMNIDALPKEFLVELKFFNSADEVIKNIPIIN
ncbi:MAG: LOG family protein [Patescibacteria group bacterium]|nr:LOG family protein [Patescibacteria group bacterium]